MAKRTGSSAMRIEDEMELEAAEPRIGLGEGEAPVAERNAGGVDDPDEGVAIAAHRRRRFRHEVAADVGKHRRRAHAPKRRSGSSDAVASWQDDRAQVGRDDSAATISRRLDSPASWANRSALRWRWQVHAPSPSPTFRLPSWAATARPTARRSSGSRTRPKTLSTKRTADLQKSLFGDTILGPNAWKSLPCD